MLAGCSAGFLNVAKIKGTHNAMKTGMLAAEKVFEEHENDDFDGKEISSYEKAVRDSWVVKELQESKNFKGGFEKGLWAGLAHGGLITHVTKGKEPWTLNHRTPDS